MRDDLRDFLQKVDALGKLRRIEGADWDLEVGTATALNLRKRDCPVLLFDDIKGYPKGYRIVTCTGSTPSLVALNLNLPMTDSSLQLLNTLQENFPQWEASLNKFGYEVVSTGPVLENIISGDDIDLFKFPTPKWHPLDGGRYISTGDVVITQDPDTGDVNLGTYRLQAHGKKTTGWHMQPIRHGDIHRRKYHDRGQPCPVAVSLGHHPLLLRMGSFDFPPGTEYQFAGAIRGEPVKVIKEEITGLPIPADSEIVLVGWCPPNIYKTEGPFGEWMGYYGRETQSLIIEVERIYHRNEPIIVGSPPGRPPHDSSCFLQLFSTARIYNELIKSGIPGIRGVWINQGTTVSYLIIISIKQQYAGHARQAAVLASQFRITGRQGTYVVVVDDDIDPTNIDEVLWAMCTRSTPEENIGIETLETVRKISGVPLDPRIARGVKSLVSSRAIIDACKPFGWADEFTKAVDLEPVVVERVRAKWKDI